MTEQKELFSDDVVEGTVTAPRVEPVIGERVGAVPRPSIGRIVIYHDRITGQKSPAIVQFADHDNSINCHVMPDNGMPFGARRVPYAKGFGEMVAWSWPERT